MSVPYFGDFAEDDTVNIPFNTFDSNDPSASVTITNLADADIKVHKDAHVDQIVTDGATVVIDFDSITGNHMINIDTSVDAAYATGSEYQVRIEGTTVDGATVNGWVGAFSIERAGGVLAILKAGTVKVDVETIKTKAVTAGSAITIRADVGAAAAPGAANGMFIGGTNAATTLASLSVTGQFDAGNVLVDGTTVLTGTTTLTGAVAFTGGLTSAIIGNITGNLSGSVGSLTGHTVQTADNNTILAHADYGNAQLVRSTTPANTLDVAATGEAGLDFANILDTTGLFNALLFGGSSVYVDPGGTDSTVNPYGTAPYPTTTIANGKTIADANSLDTFICHGDLTTTAAMEGYSFIGHGHMEVAHRINIDSHSVEHSTFKDIVIQGTMANATGALNVTQFNNSKLWALSNIHGISDGGAMLGACSVLDGGIYLARDTGCGGLGVATTLTLQAPAQCSLMNMKGTLTIAGMDGGVASVFMEHGSTLTIDNTNSAGTLTISGDTSGLTDNSAGTTVVVNYPTGNTIEVGGTTQTANDNGLDINAIKVITDALTAAAAAKLALSAGTIVAGTVSHDNTAASTTVFYSDDITEATADHYNGRIIIFTSGDLIYQATDITDYELDTGEGKFTATALTEAPADNVTFIIV